MAARWPSDREQRRKSSSAPKRRVPGRGREASAAGKGRSRWAAAICCRRRGVRALALGGAEGGSAGASLGHVAGEEG